jgi:hypothetical protein
VRERHGVYGWFRMASERVSGKSDGGDVGDGGECRCSEKGGGDDDNSSSRGDGQRGGESDSRYKQRRRWCNAVRF